MTEERTTSQPAPRLAGTGDHVKGMARGGGLNLVGAVCKQATMFLITVVLALRLGAADVGRYAECYALLSLLGLLSLAGFRAGMTRFVAINLADDDPARLRGTVRLGLGITIVASVAIGLLLALFSPQIAAAFHDGSVRTGVAIVGLTLPAATFEDAALAATQGWRSQRAYALIGSIFDPGSRLLLTFLVVALGGGLNGALWALAASAWAGAAMSAVALLRRMQGVPRAGSIYEVRQIFSFSMISWVSSLAATGLLWADTLLLGHLSTQQAVGTYTVAARLVMLAVFVMAPINAAFGPHIAHLWHVGDVKGVAQTYGTANRWIMWLSIPAFILLLAFPKDLLGFFGHGFADGAAVTMILAVGQLVSAAAGPCGTVLNMSGRVALSMVDNVAVLILNVGLNLWLIPSHGIVGAAIAWSLSLTLANLAKVLQVRYVVGVRGTGGGWGKTCLAAVPAAASAVITAHFTSGWLAAALIGGGSVTLAFTVTLMLLGVDNADAALMRSVIQRARGLALAGSRREGPKVCRSSGVE